MHPRRLVTAIATAGLVVGCTDDAATVPTTTVLSPTTTTEAPPTNDGRLTLGVLLPLSGDGAAIGQPMADAVEQAMDQINAAGGVNERRVRLVRADEGSTVASAREAITALLDADVDAVIGPASSAIALSTLAELTGAGVLTCSPSATALALDEFPDDGLFFRTIPSDSLQAGAIAQVAEETGATSAAVTFLDDAYGRPFADAAAEELIGRGFQIAAQVPFTGRGDDVMQGARAIVESAPGVVIVIGDADTGTQMVAAIGEQMRRQDVVALDVIVNGALRNPPSPRVLRGLPPQMLNNLQGVAPMATRQVDSEPPGPFATNAYDCVNLIALSAAQTGTDDPRVIAASLPAVSVQGSLCRAFDTCLELIREPLNINYDGPSGVVQLSAEGQPSRARFEVFGFDRAGLEGSDLSINYP